MNCTSLFAFIGQTVGITEMCVTLCPKSSTACINVLGTPGNISIDFGVELKLRADVCISWLQLQSKYQLEYTHYS